MNQKSQKIKKKRNLPIFSPNLDFKTKQMRNTKNKISNKHINTHNTKSKCRRRMQRINRNINKPHQAIMLHKNHKTQKTLTLAK